MENGTIVVPVKAAGNYTTRRSMPHDSNRTTTLALESSSCLGEPSYKPTQIFEGGPDWKE
jgi:hypothetical protein